MQICKRWWVLSSIAVVLAATVFGYSFITQKSNCGGNSAALGACTSYVSVLEVWSDDHPGQLFSYETASADELRQLAHLPSSWIRPPHRLLAKLRQVRIDPKGPKAVVMVCDCAYDNVPERMFGRAPMRHAVAYSTGEVGLVTPDEFARLDLKDFTDLRILDTNASTERVTALSPR
jgi:hypothetical protein